MRLPLLWLHDHVDPGLSAEALAERLAMTGTEVDRVHRHGVAALEHFRIGKVLSAERHPDADRLTVCTVDLGDGEPHQIVCGAPNVAAGQTVAVASPGRDHARRHEAQEGQAARRQESRGMILAEDEVAIGTDHDGIMVLPEELEAGSPLADALPIATDVLELEITPNRPDCLSVYGVAREVHAATGAPLGPPPWADGSRQRRRRRGREVVVEDTDLCPRFTARLFEDVKIGPSPRVAEGAAERRRASARSTTSSTSPTTRCCSRASRCTRSTSTSSPAARLIVRRARRGREDDDARRRRAHARRRRPADRRRRRPDLDRRPDGRRALRGARDDDPRADGGGRLERAEPPAHVDASSRCAPRPPAASRRASQPEQAMDGQIVATQADARADRRAAGGRHDRRRRAGPPPATIRLRDERVERLLGTAVPREEAPGSCARSSSASPTPTTGSTSPCPPSAATTSRARPTSSRRSRACGGWRSCPVTLPSRRGAAGALEPAQRLRRRARGRARRRGLSEAVGWSFAAPELPARLRLGGDDLRGRPVRLRNPMSEEQSTLRTTLLGSLLDGARRNRSRGMPDVAAVRDRRDLPRHAAAGEPRATPAAARGAHAARRAADRRDAAAVVARARARRGPTSSPPRACSPRCSARSAPTGRVEPASEPFLHPGRAARVLIGGEPAGWLGELHPAVAARLGRRAGRRLRARARPCSSATRALDPHYRDLTSFPSVRQDRAGGSRPRVAAADVIAVVRDAGGALLAGAEVFDVYADRRGVRRWRSGWSSGRADRTLTDEEVAQRRAKIDAAVAERLGGEPRG